MPKRKSYVGRHAGKIVGEVYQNRHGDWHAVPMLSATDRDLYGMFYDSEAEAMEYIERYYSILPTWTAK